MHGADQRADSTAAASTIPKKQKTIEMKGETGPMKEVQAEADARSPTSELGADEIMTMCRECH